MTRHIGENEARTVSARSGRAAGGRRAEVALILAAVALAIPAPGKAQLDTPADVARLQAMTPSCADHPDAPWVGRVVGSYDSVFDRTEMVSLVGCFRTKAECDGWKGRVSGWITGPLIRYDCTPRR